MLKTLKSDKNDGLNDKKSCLHFKSYFDSSLYHSIMERVGGGGRGG